ncbi:MAG TPA: adenylate/guanylate cyclase domain-containing protein [Gammaproteobacteria bacterium]|nr:adenylate/guanylate cyclase domain-containing protein [Gammaproteobacteria bacterium]
MGVSLEKYAIVFADVVGSTSLYESIGDTLAKECIVTIESLLIDVVKDYKGTVVEIVGDEVMCRFDDATTAIYAACAMQQAAESSAPVNGVQMSVRIGLHYGSVITEAERMFGDTVNTAARMAGIALGQQIITTESTVNNLLPVVKGLAQEFDRVAVKGKRKEIVVYSIQWRQDISATVFATKGLALSETGERLALQYRGENINIPPKSADFIMGRSTECDLLVSGTKVSRVHARLEIKRGKFVLVDQSTNGTYVVINQGEPIYLRRESLPLWGNGIIALGESIAEGSPDLIHYYCS